MKRRHFAYAILSGLVVFGIFRFVQKKEQPMVPVAREPKPSEKTATAVSPPLLSEEAPSPKTVLGEKPTNNEEPVEDQGPMEDRLLNSLKEDKAFSEIADVENVLCSGGKCQIMAEAKGESSDEVLMGVIRFLQAHPEFGLNFKKDDVKDNPKAALITVSKEKL